MTLRCVIALLRHLGGLRGGDGSMEGALADRFHQQYLSDAKYPNGYCGVGGTGLTCPVGIAPAE